MTRNQIVELYSATFNRAADADGVAYWETQTHLTQEQMANSFVISAEAVALYPTTQTNTEYVTAIYNNLFGRAPEADGLAYWVGKLDDGTDKKESMIAAFINGASPADKAVLDNKTAVSIYAVESGSNTTTVSLSSVTADAATVAAAKTAVNEANPDFGETFVLTKSATGDSIVGTALNDLITSANGTLSKEDTILDSSTTDHDIMNIETTDTVGVAARIQNIETINANGTYVGVGYDASSTAGTQNLNLSTSIVGGTASVIGASSINVANINAGTNISTLNVTAAIGGTRDTVNVDGGSASAVNLNAAAAGISKFDATIADKATLTVTDNGVLNEYTANVGATATITSTTGGVNTKTFTINAAKDSVVEISSKLTAVAAAGAGNTDFSGAGNVTAKVASANIDGQAMTSTGTGTLTVEVTGDATAAATTFKDIQADTIALKTAGTGVGTLTVNTNSTVNLLEDGTQTIDVENATGTTGVSTVGAGKGTLNLKVSESQTAITTGANVGTLLIEATPDEAADTKDGAQITVANLKAGAGNSTIVASGAADLKIGTLADSAADLVFTATQMTGKLVIGDTNSTADKNLTIIGGSNDDTIGMTVAANTADTNYITLAGAGNDTLTVKGTGTANTIVKLYGEDGNDTIDASGLKTTSAKEIVLDGGAGNDTITGSDFADTIVGGAGNDIIKGGKGADIITVGSGNDIVIFDGTDTTVKTINDAVIGTDTIILTGTANNTAALDVTALTVSAGNYSAKLGTNHSFVLKNSTATDLSNLVQFGDATTAYTAAANLDLTTGSKNDVVTTAGTSKKINLGAGDDTITVTGNVTGSITGGAGSDTFNIGADAIITDLGATDILKVTGGTTVDVTVVESFTATAATTNAIASNGTTTGTILTLNQGVDIDMTLASVAIAANGYFIKTATGGDYKLTDGATIVGSVGDDTIIGSDFADIITGGNGADTITAGKGDDTINLASAAAASDTVKFSVAADNGHDTITGFSAGATATGGDVLHVTDTATLVGSGTGTGTTATDAIYVGASSTAKGETAVSKVITISDNAATDWSDVVAKMNGALTIATDATAGNQNTIIAIDNGVDTNVYLFSDDAGTDATVEVAELTLLGTLTGLADASTFVAANFDIA